jgi:hypothetical protein
MDDRNQFTKRLIYSYTEDFYLEYLSNVDTLIGEMLSPILSLSSGTSTTTSLGALAPKE